MALIDNLVSYWELEEASGTRNDAHGTNHLTDNNTVTQGTGKVGNAADFEDTASEYLSITDNASLSVGTGSFTLCAWVRLESKPAHRGTIVAKHGSNDMEYGLRWHNGADAFEVRISSGAGFTNPMDFQATTFGAPSLATWYFVVVWFDSVGHTLNIQVNDGAINSDSYAFTSYDSGASLTIGGEPNFGEYFDGLIDQVGLWKRVLTTGEKTSLYNSGAGMSYAALSGGGTTPRTATFTDSLSGGEIL